MSDILAIDFGTTHTHATKGQSNKETVESAVIETDHKGTATALLFKNDAFFHLGHMALNTYALKVGKEEDEFELYTNFKPDIERDGDAREHAKLFLEKLAETLEREKWDSQVIIGVPASASPEYKAILKTLAKERLGQVETIPEPLGALCSFLARDKLTYSEVLSDVLVIDFGGGTCDFAYCRDGKVVNVDLPEGRWYGGRLFDDLFLQWWEEKNPEMASQYPDRKKRMLLMLHCRKAKESFSGAMERESFRKKEAFSTYDMGKYGELEDITWYEFMERAVKYRPTDILKTTCKLEPDFLIRAQHGIDLHEHFRDLLRELKEKYRENEGTYPNFKYVVLAGGSSLWPFVKDDAKEILGITEDKVLKEPDPYATIANGLARIPYMRGELEKKRERIQNETRFYCSELVKSEFEKFFKELEWDIRFDIWVNFFEGILRGYFETSIDETQLEEQLKVKMQGFHRVMKNRCQSCLKHMNLYLCQRLEEKIREDAANNGVALPRKLNAMDRFEIVDWGKLVDMTKLIPTQFVLTRLIYKLAARVRLIKYVVNVDKKVETHREIFCTQVVENLKSFFRENAIVEKTMRQIDRVLEGIVNDIDILQNEIK